MKGKGFWTIVVLLIVALAAVGWPILSQGAGVPETSHRVVAVAPDAAPEDTPLPAPQPPVQAAGESSEPPALTQPPASSPEPAAPLSPFHPFLPAGGRPRVVAVDPGHGGAEVGAGGAGLAEKNLNLAIALKLRDLLIQDGLQVVLTREEDRRVCPAPGEETPQGYSVTRADLQCRIDIANDAGADVLVSIHHNGSGDSSLSGSEVWYDGKRPFAAYNEALADQVLEALVESIRSTGYPARDRGIKEDSAFRTFNGRQYPLFVLGPPRSGGYSSRAGQMPAILGETLFLSNPYEAQMLRGEEFRDAIAQGYRNGLLRYFQLVDDGTLSMPPEGWPSEDTVSYPSASRPNP